MFQCFIIQDRENIQYIKKATAVNIVWTNHFNEAASFSTEDELVDYMKSNKLSLLLFKVVLLQLIEVDCDGWNI